MVIRSFVYRSIFIITIFILFLPGSKDFAQTINDLDFIIKHNLISKIEIKEQDHRSYFETSEIKFICIGMIRFYQKYISSQQNGKKVCVFTPGCSQFGLAAIKSMDLSMGY